MIFRRLGLLHKNQRGFTLIELMIATAVVGIITGGITMTIFGVISGNARSTNHMIAVRQVQNAGYWVSHDTQMAKNVDTTDDLGTPELELVTLTWTDWETGYVHQVVYTLEDVSGSELKNLLRSYSVNGVASETGIMAQYIDPAPTKTNCVLAGGKLILTVTVTVGAGLPQEASETRTYEIMPRPNF